MQELEQLSQGGYDSEQELEQLSRAGESSSSGLEQLVQSGAEHIQWMDMETFAKATGKTQQGISYLLNKGKLKPFREEGVRVKKTDKTYIDASLVELVKSEAPLKTVDEKEALNNQLRSTQTALIKYREFEKRIETLESEKSSLVQEVQSLKESTEVQLQSILSDKEQLSNEVESLRALTEKQLHEALEKHVQEKGLIEQEMQGLKSITEQQIKELMTGKENLHTSIQQLAQELDALKNKPWWQFWR